MVETVRPVQLPPELKTTIRGACDALAPQDEIDSRLRRGVEIAKDDKEGHATLAKRRRAARAAAVRLTTTLDKGAAEQFLAPCEVWLRTPPKPEDVQEHMLSVGLVEEFSAPAMGPGGFTASRGARPVLGSPGRKACYTTLLAFKEDVPSACAQRLYDVAMLLARALEAGSHKESGSAHAYVAGLIGQG